MRAPFTGAMHITAPRRLRVFRFANKLVLISLAIILAMLGSRLPQAQAQDNNSPRQFNVVILLDESGSMWVDTDKEIPEVGKPVPVDAATGLPLYTSAPARITAVQSLLTAMSGEWGAARFNTGIIAFGTEATTIVDLQPAATNLESNVKKLWDSHKTIRDSLATNRQYTNTRDALRLANQLLYYEDGTPKAGDPRHPGTNVVLMISDGVPETLQTVGSTDPNVREPLYTEVRAEIEQLTNRKARFISMILSTNPASQNVNYDFWANIATQVAANLSTAQGTGDSSCGFWKINSSDVLGNNALGVLQCLLGNPPPGPNPPRLDQTHTEGVYGVEEYANELLITINKNNPQIRVEVLRPGSSTPIRASANDQGDTVDHTNAGLTEGYHIKHNPGSTAPWVGCWTIRMSAQAPEIPNAQVDFITITSGDYILRFDKPSSPVWPVGKPLPLMVGVYSNTQQLVNPGTVKLDPTVSLDVSGPGQAQTLNLAGSGAVYEGLYNGNTVAGAYTLTASISGTELHRPSSATVACPNTNIQAGKLTRTLPLDVRLIPWVALVEPSPDSNMPSDDFQVRARVMTGTNALTLAPGDSVQLDVELDKGGGQSTSFRLESDPNSPAEFLGKPGTDTVLDSGTYTLTVVLLSKVGGKSTTDTAQARISLIQPPPATATTGPTTLPTVTITLPSHTVVVEPTDTSEPAIPTATSIPEPKAPASEFPWGLVLGVFAASGMLGLGFLLWRRGTNIGRMDGVALNTITGDSIPLSGTKQVKDLNGASIRFTAAATSGQPSMQVVSTTNDPVLLNGVEQNPGDPAMLLSEGNSIQVGNEEYIVSGSPRSSRRPKKDRNTQVDDEFGTGSSNYGNSDTFGTYDDPNT